MFNLNILAWGALSAWFRYRALVQTPYVNGWDGYYYLVQLQSWQTEGVMHSLEAALVYPYLWLFYWLTGDYVVAYKMGAAVLAGLFTIATAYAAQSLIPTPKPPIGLVPKSEIPIPTSDIAIIWTVLSPQLTYMAAQYPKNLLGLTLFVWLIGLVSRRGPQPVVWAVLCLNYFGHRLTFVLSILFCATYFLVANVNRWQDFRLKWSAIFNTTPAATKERSKFTRFWPLAAVGAIILASQLPGLFKWADFGRFSGVFHWPPQLAPWSFVTTFGWERLSWAWLLETAFVLLTWAGAAFGLLRHRPVVPGAAALFAVASLALFPCWEWSYVGISWRLWLVFGLLAPLMCVTIPFGSVANRRQQRKPLFHIISYGMVALVAYWLPQTYTPRLHDPNYAHFERLRATIAQHWVKFPDTKPDLLICHNALAEYITFTARVDAMPWIPEYHMDSNRLWRMASGVWPQTLRYYALEGDTAQQHLFKNLGASYVLLPEYAWQRALKNAALNGDTAFVGVATRWPNPSAQRPKWLRKN